ncbi:hypothetical protein ACFW4D_12350 [Paenibacillus lactis]
MKHARQIMHKLLMLETVRLTSRCGIVALMLPDMTQELVLAA